MEYGQEYYNWQKSIGEFGAEVDFFKIEDLLTDKAIAVLEFGCGGGFWLAKIRTERILGVEINQAARESCQKLGIPVVQDLSEVEDEAFDVCFSHHTLEHVRNPFEVLQSIRAKLKSKGFLRLVTPFVDSKNFMADDQNNHLYTWSVQNLGNLLKEAGFEVLEARYLYHTWPKNYQKEFGRGKERFHKKAIQTAKKNSIRQVIATARKE